MIITARFRVIELLIPASPQYVPVDNHAFTAILSYRMSLMTFQSHSSTRNSLGALAALFLAAANAASASAAPYRPITPSMADTTVLLSGSGLTIGQVVQVARYGAKVELTPEARQRSADAHALLLEAAAEGVSVYWFNRGSGSGRERFIFTGDPLSPPNKKLLEARQLAIFQRGALAGLGPEVSDEEVVRAMLVVRANTMSFEAASPQLTQRLLDLLNDRITPVVQSRSTVGEGDLGPFTNVGAAMVGAGSAYYRGIRMPAAEALRQAGLEPLAPFGADDSELESTNAYSTGQAALLLFDAREALSWADLIYAIDLNGMNSSVSPLAQPVQANRPFKWLNWDAARVLEMLKGSYLFELDDKRIIQDPESLRASSIRQGSAWQAWAQLRDVVLIQMNSSDHNPAVRVGASPADSWELRTPQLAQFYVKGSARNHGQHGYIFSNANWDPYPLANEIEAFTIALANMDAAVVQRMLRFTNTFFTVIGPSDEAPGEPGRFHLTQGSEIAAVALMQEIQGLINPVPPEGNALIQNVEDLQTQTRLKVTRARTAVDDTVELLAEDLLTGTYWLDMRKSQNPSRTFGASPTAVWTAFRSTLPFNGAGPNSATQPIHEIAAAFLRGNAAANFYQDNAREPDAPARRKIAE
jgi:histidine ammonia-lyase